MSRKGQDVLNMVTTSFRWFGGRDNLLDMWFGLELEDFFKSIVAEGTSLSLVYILTLL